MLFNSVAKSLLFSVIKVNKRRRGNMVFKTKGNISYLCNLYAQYSRCHVPPVHYRCHTPPPPHLYTAGVMPCQSLKKPSSLTMPTAVPTMPR